MSVDVSFFMFLRWARLEAATGSRTGLHVLWLSAEYVAAIAPYGTHHTLKQRFGISGAGMD